MEIRELQIPNEDLVNEVKQALNTGHSATFRVKGYSMRPFLENERDIVKLSYINPQNVKVNDVILAEIAPHRYVLHRVIKRKEHQLILMGDGNIRGAELCNDTNVIGIATAFYRNKSKKPDLTTGKKWRFYTKIWLALKPFRRWILAIHRRLPSTKKYNTL